MLTQAQHIIREEVPSLEKTNLITKISYMGHQNKAKTSKKLSIKEPTIDIGMVCFIPIQFLANINQPNNLMGDVFAEEAEWAKLSKEVVNKPIFMQFPWPSEDLIQHLKPLYIKALINGKLINQVFIDGRVILNVMCVITLKKLGKNKFDLISTNMKMTNFTGDITIAMWVLAVDLTIGVQNTQLCIFYDGC